MLFCSIDTAVPDRKYANLRADKGLTGLPTLAFLDADGAVLLRVPARQRTVAGIRKTLERAQAYVALRASAKSGEPDAIAQFLLVQLEERQVPLPDAKKRRARLDPAPGAELLAAIDLRILDLEVSAAVTAAGQGGRYKLGPRFLAMLREGPRPSPEVTRGFWFAMLEWAERQRDAEAFAEALSGMRAALRVTDPDELWVPRLLSRYEATLAKLRSGGR